MTSKKQQFDPRRAEPGAAFSYVDPEGREHTFRADDEGVVRPANATEANVADRFGLPVARKAQQADKSAGDGGKE
jgi:hypothetical protein